MSIIHFLNVLEGDCNIIQHDSGRISVIDISNASNEEETAQERKVRLSKERKEMRERTNVPSDKTNYYQKLKPDNPINYLQEKIGTDSIFRFIITHPDMDHLDGIQDLYDEFTITNTWDTDNVKVCDINNFFGGYNVDDWKFYLKLRAGQVTSTKRLTLYAGNSREYYKDDHLNVLCPTKALLANAAECDDYNDSSYVLLYSPPKKGGGNWKILFAGDSHDGSWEYILKNYKEEVSNVDILFAPHHGRDSDRDYAFLDTVKPTVTLFGNASSEHLAYKSYPETRITNNQAGYVIMDISEDRINLYVKHYDFARDFRKNPKRNWTDPTYDADFDAWFLASLSS